MGGKFINKTYYPRKINPGDTIIEGRASNGLTLDNTGNIFLYSSQNQEILNQLISSSYTGSVEVSPNTDSSFIGIISTSTDTLISKSPININMGSTNYNTLNLENNSSNYITTTEQSSTSSTTTSSGTPIKVISNPTQYTGIASGYGFRNFRGGQFHEGIDLIVGVGTPVRAAWSGEVVGATTYSGYGNAVIISHTNASGSGKDYSTLYSHLSKIDVIKSQTVTAGQQIGLSGGAKGDVGAGNSESPHLHFEVSDGKSTDNISYKALNTLDPKPFLLGENNTGLADNENDEPLELLYIPPPTIEFDESNLMIIDLPEFEGEYIDTSYLNYTNYKETYDIDFSPKSAPTNNDDSQTGSSPTENITLTDNQQQDVQNVLNSVKISYTPRSGGAGVGAGAGCKKSNRTPMTKEENVYYMISLLKYGDIPINEYTLAFMFAWRQIEGACALYNGFNSTLSTGCVKTSNGVCVSLNDFGIKDYTNFNNGIKANAGLWKKDLYKVIAKYLKTANSYADLYRLLDENSNGPRKGAFYVWSQGFYDTRVTECNGLRDGSTERTKGKKYTDNLRKCGQGCCPPPVDVKDTYIKPILKNYEKNKQITIVNPIYKPS